MSARDDYPFPAAVADGRVRGGAYGQQESAAALDEIDLLRGLVSSVGASLVIHPGDTLIIRHRCTAAQGASLKHQMATLLPQVKVAVLGVDEIAVIRAGVTP